VVGGWGGGGGGLKRLASAPWMCPFSGKVLPKRILQETSSKTTEKAEEGEDIKGGSVRRETKRSEGAR